MPAGPRQISAAEVESHLQYVQRALDAVSDGERADALSDQILAFGHRALLVWNELATLAPEAQQPFYAATLDEATSLYARWMNGATLTDNPSEAERRALAGLAMLEERPDLPHLYHYAARAVLELDEGHPRRDVALARRRVLDELEWLHAQGESASAIAVAGALRISYDERFADDARLEEWVRWVESIAARLEAQDALQLWTAVEGWYVARSEDGRHRQWLDAARGVRARIDALPLTPALRAESGLGAARLYVHEDDQRPIAELYRKVLETGGLAPGAQRGVARMEARLRSRYGEPRRVVDLLESILDELEFDYVTAIRDVDRADTGQACAEASALLAFAFAALGRWRDAVEAIERGKCLRQRHALALRETPAAARLLAIEGELYALSRGLVAQEPTPAVEQVRDWFAQGLSPQAQLREAYRALRPRLDRRRGTNAIDFDAMAAGLRDGEAALSLGLWWNGLMMALLVRGRAEPVWTSLRADLAQSTVGDWLAGGEGAGEAFLLALERGLDSVDPRPALERLLADLDAAIGAPVAAALAGLGITRLVVLPHNFLRLAPLWALESWRSLEVRMLPGAFALLDPRCPAVRARALLVADPTLDLPLAASEAALAGSRLHAAGLAIDLLHGAQASEAALAGALAGAGLLHFAGHGIASLTDGSRCALLTRIVWSDTPFDDAAGVVALAAAGGDDPRLGIDQDEGAPRRKIFYEYAKSGTVYVEAEGDAVRLAGELWRAGDILVQGTLRGCGLAFLCACSSGLGAIEALEEASGLPAALQLAGVGCVIGTGWPVADEITLLFADEFYARAFGGGGGTIPVAAAVRGAAEALRTLPREQAVQRVEALAVGAPDKMARLRVRVFARRLAQGPALPFAHPFDTGAFFVTGAAHVKLEAA